MTIAALNPRNKFMGRIKEITESPVVSEIIVDTSQGLVTSIISTRSLHELDLQIGTKVVALVKATEVSLARL